MKLTIQKDFFGNPHPPRIFLCTTGKKRIGQLPTYDEKLNASWNKYSELSFSINRQYTDAITGETVIDPLFDKAEGLRKVYVENVGYFTIQDPDTTYSDGDTKTISAFSSEYECASKYLENFKINTGDVDSAEVMYLEDIYGEGYTIDTPYEVAPQGSDNFDAYEKYFVKEYTDAESYTYEQVEIANSATYITYDGSTVAKTLYRKKYPNVRFYWPTKPELSLLHLVFEKIPEWNIGNVDATLRNQERKFDEERIAVYDFLMNEVADTFKCIIEWDTINGVVNFYEEEENGITEENTVQERFDTNIYITRENLANEINIKYSSDDIKTKLKVSGSDDLDIREVNLGSNYIMNLDFYHNSDWMEDDLYSAYDAYKENVEIYSPQYTEAVSGRVAAYNRWNELMNAVPADGNVILIGDEFEKLYCIYEPMDTAYYPSTITSNSPATITDLCLTKNDYDATPKVFIDKTSLSNGDAFIIQGHKYLYNSTNNNFQYDEDMHPNSLQTLIEQLRLYNVDEDTQANKTDNVLLTLKNVDSDSATIRIYSIYNLSTNYSPNVQYYTRIGTSALTYRYTAVYIDNSTEYNAYSEPLYTNTYKIQCIITRASSGLMDNPSEYDLTPWIEGKLRTDNNSVNGMNNLDGFKVASIGTLGAYLVLAKDEKQQENLVEYGVNLLREKQDTYTKIFQTQTEAMWSQEKYQCIASSTEPSADVAVGTRWFKTDEAILYIRTESLSSEPFLQRWNPISIDGDSADYKNYQRYIDNFEKLESVQRVLNRKEKEAQYCLEGYQVSSMRINPANYPFINSGNTNNYYNSNGESLSSALATAASKHFYGDGGIITQGVFIKEIPLLPFSHNGDDYAVYLKDNIPYIAYASSVGVYQSKMNYIAKLTNFENSFTEDQWIRLSPLIREDEFSDSNFLLTGYESEEERLSICQELMQEASKELKTLAQPSLEFSMNMANILALPEFSSLTSQFELGNFIRIELRPGLVKRARLLSVDIDFNNLSSFSCQFGNLITTKDQIDLHADLMKQAIQAGKQVATSASDWQRAVDKSNRIEQAIANGLQEATLEVGKASGQSIEIGQYGIWGRKLVDGTTDEYEDEQFRIMNNKLVFSNDAFKTSKALFGKFEYDADGDGTAESHFGVLADALVGGYVQGSRIEGGSLKIGTGDTYFQVDEDGSVAIMSNGQAAYADADVVTEIENSRQYRVELVYSNSTVFNQPNQSCQITAKVYKWDEDITSQLPVGTTYTWIRNSSSDDTAWNSSHVFTKTSSSNNNVITITNADVNASAQISCQIDFDDTNL